MTTTPITSAISTPPAPGRSRIAGAPIPAIDRILEQYQATQTEVLVLSATSGQDGYDSRPILDNNGWDLLLRNLNRISHRAAELGVREVLHPRGHHGRERRRGAAGAQRLLDLVMSGHRSPVDRRHRSSAPHPAGPLPHRPHTHLKDVNSQIADKVRAGRLSYTEAVVEGTYGPLGTGDVDVETIVSTLQGNGHSGWYTLEQDTILTEEPRGEGPMTDVRTSAANLRSLLTTAGAEGASAR